MEPVFTERYAGTIRGWSRNLGNGLADRCEFLDILVSQRGFKGTVPTNWLSPQIVPRIEVSVVRWLAFIDAFSAGNEEASVR